MVQQERINLGNKITLSQGNRVTNQYGPQGAIGDFITVLESPHYEEDGTIQQFNVQTWIGAPNLPADGTGRLLAILGKITWGIGGATFEADFDWKVGNQLSFAASFFRIDAAFSETGDECPTIVSIGAMQSSGGRASRSQVTRTYPRLVISDDEPVLFPVPPYAHALYLFGEPAFYGNDGGSPPVDNVQVRYVGGASAGFSAVSTDLESFSTGASLFRDALVNEDGVRFPEAARMVEVTTAVADTDYHFTPTFTLNF